MSWRPSSLKSEVGASGNSGKALSFLDIYTRYDARLAQRRYYQTFPTIPFFNGGSAPSLKRSRQMIRTSNAVCIANATSSLHNQDHAANRPRSNCGVIASNI
jgi:hypothetical protein